MDEFKNKLEKKTFDIEHAMNIYADSCCTFPAEYIYDESVLQQYESIIKSCHIYIIGYLSRATLIKIEQEDNKLTFEYKISGCTQFIYLDLPNNYTLIFENAEYYVQDDKGHKRIIPEDRISSELSQYLEFDVRYIGQAYGKNGKRNALDRLLKHETLQKISLSQRPANTTLSLLLLQVEPNTQILTAMNPFARNQDVDGIRIKAGLDKLLNTNEQEIISLYEAALIRYFNPQFNKEFKNSFPSTNLKVLQDCYKKDFSAVFAEINVDGLPFKIGSEKIPVSNEHLAIHYLHDDFRREAFFYGD